MVLDFLARKIAKKKFGWKTRENVVDLHFLVVYNFDFPRKIAKFAIFGTDLKQNEFMI